MNGDRDPTWGLDFHDPEFLADPYPALGRVREATPMFRNEQTGQWMLTRFGDVYENGCLCDLVDALRYTYVMSLLHVRY